MRFLILAISLLFASVKAQTLLVYGDNDLPTCAQQCQVLQQAQSACVPPAAPLTNQATYESCFCQSGYLSTLSSSATSVCDGICSASDQVKIQSWYAANCKDDGADVAAAAVTTTAAATTAGATSASTLASAATDAASPSTSAVDGTKHRDWWDKHWRWVLMVIILLIGFIAVAIGGALIKRHYDRKADKNNSSFNQGITHRSAPMTTTQNPFRFNHDMASNSIPGTPTPHGQHGGSSIFLPNVRERDRRTMQRSSNFNVVHDQRQIRGGTPAEDLEAGKLDKGKGRANFYDVDQTP